MNHHEKLILPLANERESSKSDCEKTECGNDSSVLAWVFEIEHLVRFHKIVDLAGGVQEHQDDRRVAAASVQYVDAVV